MKTSCLIGGLLIAAFTSSTCQAQLLNASEGDWPWWRGPNFNGVAEAGQQAPVAWSETKNVAWKATVPGRGHSSPTVVGNRILLATADDQAQVQSVVCFDRKTGKQLWNRDVNRGSFPSQIQRKNTHASCTIACDGARLFAVFYHHDRIEIVALDLSGDIAWRRIAGEFEPRKYKNGYAASPLLFGDFVIVAADHEGAGFLAAFDRTTGKPVWKTLRPSLSSYASPIVARVAGRDQLLISGCELVASYNPGNGRLLWKTTATTMQAAGTMVWDGDLVFASGGFPEPETVSVRADGSGEIVWRNSQKLFEQSMLVHEGHVYAINDNGIAICWEARTGAQRWRKRLQGPISASPILSDGKIYLSNELGTTWVYRASPEQFGLIAENQLGSEAFATPTICGGQIFLRVADVVGDRRQETLYCIQTPGAQ